MADRQAEEARGSMMKFVIAGVLGLLVAGGLGVGGYQAGLFDGFKPSAPDAQSVADAKMAEPETAAADDASKVAAEAPAILPTFDIVRIEPTGDAVVAGLSAPKAIVALVANGAVIGKTTSNASGEWAIVLTEPLAPGDYDVAIHAASEDGKTVESTQRVTVSIPKTRDEDVLVVMNAEGEASTILQKPVAELAAGTAVVAQTSEQKSDAARDAAKVQVTAALQEKFPPEKSLDTTGADSTVSAETSAAVNAETSTETRVVADVAASDGPTPMAATQGTATAETAAASTPDAPETSTADVAGAVVAGEAASMDGASSSAPAASSEVASAPQATAAQSESAVEASTKPAETTVAVLSQPNEPAPAASSDAASSEPAGSSLAGIVSVEAVETEKGRLFVAGNSAPGSSVRIYVGDEHVGDVTANKDGRWLLETNKVLSVGQHNVRADIVTAGGNDVIARAAVTFEREKDDIILRAVSSSSTASGSGSTGSISSVNVATLPNVIIRRGDNLWRISQRLYGEGLRYTTIYQANKGQIRDPDLIYPGQVFLTPQAAPDAAAVPSN